MPALFAGFISLLQRLLLRLDISSALTSIIPAPRFNAISGSFGYADVEAKISTPNGATYVNVTTPCYRVWISGAWSCISTSSGSGIVTPAPQFQLPFYSSPGTVGSISGETHITTDGSGNLSLATSRPALSPVADVTNAIYGAKGDGIADDAPAGRAALAAINAAGGGTIYFPKGTYLLNSTAPGHSNVIFFGNQMSHIHFKCDPGALIINPIQAATIFMMGFPAVALQSQTGYQANVLTNPNSPTITLTTAADTSHFAVGDPIYILGGPSFESNGDGEVNWITAIDGVGGVLTLRVPTAKPYTGNNSNVGAANIVTVIPGIDHSVSPAVNRFFYDESVEGCNVQTYGDFSYIGQVIGAKIMNNTVTVNPASTRGQGINAFYPMANVEVGGNVYTQATLTFSQLDAGMRDWYIHDNTLMSPYGVNILQLSEGVVNTNVTHNNFYLYVPSTSSNLNQGAVIISTAYQANIANNIMQVNIQNTQTANNAMNLGQTNGSCLNCTVSGNTIFFTGPDTIHGTGINDFGSNATITGNNITMFGGRFGIATQQRGTSSYAISTINANTIHLVNPGSLTTGIVIQGTANQQSQVSVIGNNIYGDSVSSNGIGIAFNITGGGIVTSNNIYNLGTGITTTAASPLMVANQCAGVTTTTNCSVLPDLGAQKFTGNVSLTALATPTVATPIASLTNGTLADATQFCYQVQARNASGYSAPSTEQCITTGSGGGTNSVTLNWNNIPGATTYAIYGRTTGAEAHMSPDLNFTKTTFTDTGSTTPSGAIQATMGAPPIEMTEFSNGTCTTAKTITPNNGNRQNVTLTNGSTCALTFTQPGGGLTVNMTLKVIQSSVSTFNGGISGCKWPGGVTPTITQTSGAIDYIGVYLDGTNAYCTASQNFQ